MSVKLSPNEYNAVNEYPVVAVKISASRTAGKMARIVTRPNRVRPKLIWMGISRLATAPANDLGVLRTFTPD